MVSLYLFNSLIGWRLQYRDVSHTKKKGKADMILFTTTEHVRTYLASISRFTLAEALSQTNHFYILNDWPISGFRSKWLEI